jgi:hypothetical protein
MQPLAQNLFRRMRLDVIVVGDDKPQHQCRSRRRWPINPRI